MTVYQAHTGSKRVPQNVSTQIHNTLCVLRLASSLLGTQILNLSASCYWYLVCGTYAFLHVVSCSSDCGALMSAIHRRKRLFPRTVCLTHRSYSRSWANVGNLLYNVHSSHSLCVFRLSMSMSSTPYKSRSSHSSGPIFAAWTPSWFDGSQCVLSSVLAKVICAVFYVWFIALTPCFKLTSFFTLIFAVYYQLLHYIVKSNHVTGPLQL